MIVRKRRPAGNQAGPVEASVHKISAGGVRATGHGVRASAHPKQNPDIKRAAHKLSEAIRIPTVSYADYSHIDLAHYRRFHSFLKRSFPLVHRHLEFHKINDFALLFFWKGSEPSLKPYLLAAHFDVVPAEDSPGKNWNHPPFSGHNDGKYVWGRGTLDIKMSLISILEAAECLLATGFRPKRGVYFAFGGDEEIDGKQGARNIALYLADRGVDLEFVLDEGTVIALGLYPGIVAPMALISIAEKGHCNIDLRVTTTGGHSCLPPKETAVAILCQGVARLQKRTFPARLTAPVVLFLKGLGRHVASGQRQVVARPKLFWPILKLLLSKTPNTDAMIRTSRVVTMVKGSDKENVLPITAEATVNVRILPGETINSVIEWTRKAVGDPRIEVYTNPRWLPNEPVQCSDPDSFGYRVISGCVKKIVPGTIVLPFLLSGSTDSKHYTALTPNIYRFSPVMLNEEELRGIHGVNERISLENLSRCLVFYTELIRMSSD